MVILRYIILIIKIFISKYWYCFVYVLIEINVLWISLIRDEEIDLFWVFYNINC